MEFQNKHKNLFLLEHETNKKQGAARNTGLRAAKGEYIWFVDADDYIRDKSITELISICDDNQLDLLLFSPGPETVCFLSREPISGIEYMEKWLKTGMQNPTMYCIWARIIRRKMIVDNDIYFYEGMSSVDDVAYSYLSVCYSKRLMSIPENYYCYVVDTVQSVTRARMNADKLYSSVFLNASQIIRVADIFKPKSVFVCEELKKDAAWWISCKLKKPFGKITVKEQLKFIDRIKKNRIFVRDTISQVVIYLNNSDKKLLHSFSVFYFLIIPTLVKRCIIQSAKLIFSFWRKFRR
jgi:glycosyltransferase involved in cell wall biosynthesis